MISEVFPTNIRASGSSLTYQLGNSLISGSATFFSALQGKPRVLPMSGLCGPLGARRHRRGVDDSRDEGPVP